MQAAAMRDHLRDRMFEVRPAEFEILCKMVLVRRLDTRSLQVTAFQQDDGIDIEGIIDEGIIRALLGVQVKRYSEGNTVGNNKIRGLHGALAQANHQIGTCITSSSFSGPAVSTAEELQICLVDGDQLAGREVRRWGLTRAGVEYLRFHDQGNTAEAREQLVAGIRDVEIVKRVYSRLEDEGELSYDEVRSIIAQESTFSESSIGRRGSTVLKWLRTLPEVEEQPHGHSKKLVRL